MAELFACVGLPSTGCVPFLSSSSSLALDAITGLSVYHLTWSGDAVGAPPDYVLIDRTLSGHKADITRSFWAKGLRICYKRGHGPRGVPISGGSDDGSVYTIQTDVGGSSVAHSTNGGAAGSTFFDDDKTIPHASSFGAGTPHGRTLSETNILPTEDGGLNPIVDIALYSADTIPAGWESVRFTPTKQIADLSASGAPHGKELLLCYRRAYGNPAADSNMDHLPGFVTDVCVVLTDRDEVLPPNFVKAECHSSKYGLASGVVIAFRRGPGRGLLDVRYTPEITQWLRPSRHVPSPHGVSTSRSDDISSHSTGTKYQQWAITPSPMEVNSPPPQFLPLFAFPRGIPIKVRKRNTLLVGGTGSLAANVEASPYPRKPKFVTFGLTNEQGAVTYGYCLTFEDVVADSLRDEILMRRQALRAPASSTASRLFSDDTDEVTVTARQALCVLSRWPFADFFKRFLLDLFVSVCSRPLDSDKVTFLTPEPRVQFLLNSVTVPDPGHRVDVRVFPDLELAYSPIIRPPIVSLTPCESSFIPLVTALTPASICVVMSLLLTEQRVVVHCKSAQIAGDCAVVLKTLLFPLQWELFFVPIVPANMLGFLDAPTPFLVGMPTQLLPTQLPEDVYTVDLDRGRVTLGHHHVITEPPTPLPRKAAQRFQRRCLAILKQVDLEAVGGREAAVETYVRNAVREAWLRFMCTILAGYRSFITAPIAALAAPPGTPGAPVTTAPGSGASGELIANFDVAGFVASFKSPRLRVLRQRLCSCQSWQSFIEGACSSGRKSLALVFFDACLEAVHTWPGKDDDGPDNHSMIDIGTYGAAAVASKSETCLCGRRNRRRPSDLSPQCPFCKLVLVPTRQLNSSVPIRIDFGAKASSRPASPAHPKADAAFDHGVVMTMNSFLNAKDGLPPAAGPTQTPVQGSGTQPQQQSATVDDVLFRNRDKRSWPKWDSSQLLPAVPLKKLCISQWDVTVTGWKPIKATVSGLKHAGFGAPPTAACLGYGIRLPLELLGHRFSKSAAQHKIADFAAHDATACWLMLTPIAVSFSPDETEFISQTLKVMKDIPKRDVRIDEANVRSVLAVLLSSTRADIGHVAQVAEELKKSTGNSCGNALSFGMACSAVASVTYRRSLFSPMAYARSVSREDVIGSDGSPQTTRLELVSADQSVASEGRTAELASVVDEADTTASLPAPATHRRTKSEPVTALPNIDDIAGEIEDTDVIPTHLPATSPKSSAMPPHEADGNGEFVSPALPHPSSSAQRHWKMVSTALQATHNLMAAVQKGVAVPRSRAHSESVGLEAGFPRLRDDDDLGIGSISPFPAGDTSFRNRSRSIVPAKSIPLHPLPAFTSPADTLVERSRSLSSDPGPEIAENSVVAVDDDNQPPKSPVQAHPPIHLSTLQLPPPLPRMATDPAFPAPGDGLPRSQLPGVPPGVPPPRPPPQPPLPTSPPPQTPRPSPTDASSAVFMPPAVLSGGNPLASPGIFSDDGNDSDDANSPVDGERAPVVNTSEEACHPSQLLAGVLSASPSKPDDFFVGVFPDALGSPTPSSALPTIHESALDEVCDVSATNAESPAQPGEAPFSAGVAVPTAEPVTIPEEVQVPVDPGVEQPTREEMATRSQEPTRTLPRARAVLEQLKQTESLTEPRPVSRSLSTPVFSSGVTGLALGALTPCRELVCARFGHVSSAHDVIAAVAMWSFNECAHCKAALAASTRSRQPLDSFLPPPTTVTNPATPLYMPITPNSTDSEAPGISAASHAPNPDSPSIASDVPITVADDELTTSVLTDGIGMLMDEQVMLGWGPVFDDGTTFCPVCRERFTPVLHFRLWRASGSVESSQCLYMSPSLVRAEMETLLNRVCDEETASGVLTVDDLLESSPNLYWNCLWYNRRLNLPQLQLPLSLSCNAAVSPVVTVGWTQQTALSAMAKQLPDSLAMISSHPSIQASLTPTEPMPAELELPSEEKYSVISVMLTALRCDDLRGAVVSFLAGRADAPDDPFYSRSLYVVCLLLSVKYGLFGFHKPEGDSWAVVSAGTGQLEDGLLLALQALGDTGVDEFVKKKDWPPIDTALRFRQNFGFLLK